MNGEENKPIVVDSIEISPTKLRVYISNKLIEGGINPSRLGFRYMKEILFVMMKDVNVDRTVSAYAREACNEERSSTRVDKAVSSAIEDALYSGGLKELDAFMFGAIKRRHTTAGVLFAFREYLRACLYNDSVSESQIGKF